MRWKWTVGRQIGAGIAVSLAMMAFLIILALHNTREFMATGDRVTRTHQVLNTLGEVLSLLKDAETGERGFIITGKEEFLEPFNHAEVSLAGLISNLRQLTSSGPEQQRNVAALRSLVDLKFAELRSSINVRRTQGFQAAHDITASGHGKQSMDKLRALVAEVRALEQRSLAAREAKAAEEARSLIWTLVGGALFILALIVLAGLIITRSLERQIGSAIAHVQGSSTELQTAASQQASGAREQASATTEISTTVRELLSASRQIADNAQRVTRVTEDASAAAHNGNEAVARAQQSIDMVRRQVDAVVNHMLELGRRSQEFGGILDIINELAEQTNILAINATIESAGAGEHGRRFAVVAEEIRKLADRVGSSTKDMRMRIDQIRAAANTTIMATEDSSKAVQGSTRQFAEVAGGFKRIAELVRTNLDVARQIELSTQQQTSAVELVSAAIMEVAQTARRTETSSAQTLQTATQLIGLSKQLSTLITPTSPPA